MRDILLYFQVSHEFIIAVSLWFDFMPCLGRVLLSGGSKNRLRCLKKSVDPWKA